MLLEMVFDLFLTERQQHRADAVARAAAGEIHRLGIEHAQRIFVKQAAQHGEARRCREFGFLQGLEQHADVLPVVFARSEEHTSELQSLMRISYAVFCLNKKTTKTRK